jgi:hypothetical protein
VSWCPHSGGRRAHPVLWRAVNPNFGASFAARAVVPAQRTTPLRALGGTSRDRAFPITDPRIPVANANRKAPLPGHISNHVPRSPAGVSAAARASRRPADRGIVRLGRREPFCHPGELLGAGLSFFPSPFPLRHFQRLSDLELLAADPAGSRYRLNEGWAAAFSNHQYMGAGGPPP